MRDRSNQLHDSSVTVPIPFHQRVMRLFTIGAFANLSAFFIFGCLMLAMIAVSGYAGMRAGDNDKKVRIESTVSGYVIERYERGVDLFRSGNYALAAANFQEVLKYRPDYTAVRPLLATAQMAQTPHPATPTPTAIPVLTDKNKLVELIQDANTREEWDAVIALSDQLRSIDSAFEAETVNGQRYNALVNRGIQRIRGKDIEAGIYDLDQAEEIQPLSRTAKNGRDSAAAYLNAMSYFGADWERTIEMLGQLSPAYRDVGEKLYEANLRAGDAYSSTQDYCHAQVRYTEALNLAGKLLPKLDRKRADVTLFCSLATPTPSISGTLTVSGTGSAGANINASDMTGRILYNAYDGTSGYSSLHVFNGTATVIIGGGYQPAYQPATGAVALNGGSSINAWYAGGGTGQLYNVTAYWPSISPDSTRVAYGGADGFIYVARIDNSVAPISITQGTWPIWGPSGYIAYQGCSDQCGVHIINPDNASDSRRLTSSSADVNMQWSSNGNDIAYASSYSGAWEIYIVNLAGGLRQLTNYGASSSAPVFSPDGGRVAFESSRDGSWGIYTMNVDGTNLQKILDLGSTHASWQSDRLAWLP